MSPVQGSISRTNPNYSHIRGIPWGYYGAMSPLAQIYYTLESTDMKQFESQLQAKAHLKRIHNAKPTLAQNKSKLPDNRLPSQTELQLILHLYDLGEYQSIPLYKLLKPVGLQQYTRELILRGYGVNISRLTHLTDKDRQKLFEDIKVLPGHTTKFNKILQSLLELTQDNRSVYTSTSVSSSTKGRSEMEYEDELDRVLSQYSVKGNKPVSKGSKKEMFEVSNSEKKDFRRDKSKDSKRATTKLPLIRHSDPFMRPNTEKKSTQMVSKETLPRRFSREKKNLDFNKTNIKTFHSSKKSLPPSLKSLSQQKKTLQHIDSNLQVDKIKGLYLSVDGAIMTSTIVNVDLQQTCCCIATFLQKMIQQPQRKVVSQYDQTLVSEQAELNEEDMSNILRESYLHPLYINQNISHLEDCDEEVGEEIEPQIEHESQATGANLEESFLLGNSSVSFGVERAAQIFDEPNPSEVDYYVPTVDSLSNFIKNIVITAKMEREVPVLSLLYILKFMEKSQMPLTSLNYKRVVVSCLLLSSKIWDDESFETPSFSHTFPDYSTVLLNELQKQILVSINYELKLNKKEYALLYYQLRGHRQPSIRSFQNRILPIKRVMELQQGVLREYKADHFKKRKSF